MNERKSAAPRSFSGSTMGWFACSWSHFVAVLCVTVILLTPASAQAGAATTHPHAMLELLLDANDGSIDHHHHQASSGFSFAIELAHDLVDRTPQVPADAIDDAGVRVYPALRVSMHSLAQGLVPAGVALLVSSRRFWRWPVQQRAFVRWRDLVVSPPPRVP